MTSDKEFEHAPDANLDYGFDWSLWLEYGEEITSSTWTVDPSLVQTFPTITNGVTAVFVEGGTHGVSYKITNHIETNKGRKDSRTLKLLCKNR